MSQFKYVITDAAIQCGTQPPFNVIRVPVRMWNDIPQVKIRKRWIACPKDGPRPNIKTFYGMPVAGITTSWELAR